MQLERRWQGGVLEDLLAQQRSIIWQAMLAAQQGDATGKTLLAQGHGGRGAGGASAHHNHQPVVVIRGCRNGRKGRHRQCHPDLPLLHADREGLQIAASGRLELSATGDVEDGVMPRADDALAMQHAFGQRTAIMGAFGAGGADGISDAGNQHLDARHRDLPHASRLQLRQRRDTGLRHYGLTRLQNARRRSYPPHVASSVRRCMAD